MFIKSKPTIIYCIFASILLYGVYFKKEGYTKYMTNSFIKLQKNEDILLSKQMAILLIILSIINQILVMYFTDTEWMIYKTAVCPIVISCFILYFVTSKKNIK
jgi:intracellular septation protein A